MKSGIGAEDNVKLQGCPFHSSIQCLIIPLCTSSYKNLQESHSNNARGQIAWQEFHLLVSLSSAIVLLTECVVPLSSTAAACILTGSLPCCLWIRQGFREAFNLVLAAETRCCKAEGFKSLSCAKCRSPRQCNLIIRVLAEKFVD